MKSKLLLISFLLLGFLGAHSQCYYYFGGQVTDQNNSPLNGVQVTITGTESNGGNVIFTANTTTDPNGYYSFCNTATPPNGSTVQWTIVAYSCGIAQTYVITSTPNNTSGWQFSQNIQLNCGPATCESIVTYNISNGVVVFNVASMNGLAPSQAYWVINGNSGSGSGGTYTYVPSISDSVSGVLNICSYPIYASGCMDTVCTTINIPTAPCYYTFQGYVYDQSGNPVANQDVVITGANSGLVVYSQTVTTNSQGFYSFCFPQISPNTYIWTVNTNACGQNNFYTVNTTPNNMSGSVFNNDITLSCNISGGCASYPFVSSNNIITGSTVNFFNQSTGVYPISYAWDFGDGSTGTGGSPSHTYVVAGTYTACLTIADSNGCSSVGCVTITVADSTSSGCQATITVAADPNSINGITYSAQSNPFFGTISNVYWDFGNGNTSSNTSGTFNYNSPGTYNVCAYVLFVGGCVDTLCTSVTVGNSAGCQTSVTIQGSGNPMPNTPMVLLVSGGGMVPSTCVWTINGIQYTSSGGAFTFVPGSTGVYVACVIATYSSGCIDSACTQFNVVDSTNNCNAVANVFTTPSSLVTQYSASGSSGVGSGVGVWDFGDGSPLVTGSAGSHTFPGPGTYYVCLTVTYGNCTDTDCISVTVGNNTGFGSICGCVQYMNSNGSLTNAECGTAYLVQYDPNTNILTAVDTAQITPNGYCFNSLPAGAFTIKAALCSSSAGYSYSMPTYFGNELFWYNADQILVNGMYVNPGCITLVSGNNPGGPGFIGGNIFMGANKTLNPGDPIADIDVLLLNTTDGAITHTVTDVNGAYSFSSLAYGTYKIYPEYPGINTYPIYVTIGPNNPSATGENFDLNQAGFMDIQEAGSSFESLSNLYPNPAKEKVSIDLVSKVNQSAVVTLLNAQGQQVMLFNHNIVTGNQTINIATESLSKGFYIVRIQSGNTSKEFKLFKAE